MIVHSITLQRLGKDGFITFIFLRFSCIQRVSAVLHSYEIVFIHSYVSPLM